MDARELIVPPRDIEAGVRESDTASIAMPQDRGLEPFNPADYDNPGRFDESPYDYALYGDE